jgi:hypothetical protein
MEVPVVVVVEPAAELLQVETATRQIHRHLKATMVDQAPERLITVVAVAAAQLVQALAEPLQLAAMVALARHQAFLVVP